MHYGHILKKAHEIRTFTRAARDTPDKLDQLSVMWLPPRNSFSCYLRRSLESERCLSSVVVLKKMFYSRLMKNKQEEENSNNRRVQRKRVN